MQNTLPIYGLLLVLLISCTPSKDSDKTIDGENNLGKSVTVDSSQTNKHKRNYLRAKAILNYVQSTKPIELSLSYPSPFDTLVFDKVIAYDFDGIRSPSQSILQNNDRLVSAITKQEALNASQADFVLDFLTDKSTYGGVRYACFEPHLAFVFYESGKIKMVVDICLDCNFLRASSKIPATEANLFYFDDDTSYPRSGFSEAGIKRIVEISAELGLGYGKWEEKKIEEE